MKQYTTKTTDSSGNIFITNENYSNTGILQTMYTDTYDINNIHISSVSINYYDNTSQINFTINMNYNENYTTTKAYYKTGQLKGESYTVNNIYVIHKKYNEDGTLKKEWRTELPHIT